MANEYVEQRNGGYYVLGTRVSLDSVVYAFLRGESPEGIAESFPALSLEQVYGAIAFYLANQRAIDAYLEEGRLSSPGCEKRLVGSIPCSMPSWTQRDGRLPARAHEATVPG